MRRSLLALLLLTTIPAQAGPATQSEARPLREGYPAAWLVGGIMDGKAGLSLYGLDTERITRANPGQPYASVLMSGALIRQWVPIPSAEGGAVLILAHTDHSYGWSYGTGYAQLYMHNEQPRQLVLHLVHTGVRTGAWLNGEPCVLQADDGAAAPSLPPDWQAGPPGDRLAGLTAEGLVATARGAPVEGARRVTLDLPAGWSCLLLKFVMQLPAGKKFGFAARFCEIDGRSADGLITQVSDPQAALDIARRARIFRPLIHVEAPGNLPTPGERLVVRVALDWHPLREEPRRPQPAEPFQARLCLRLTDYDGRELATREVVGEWPATVSVDFGPCPPAGYYALYPSLRTLEGQRICDYWADGFTVVNGTAAQRERVHAKKVWNNDYYAMQSGDVGFAQRGGFNAWLARSGILRNIGSSVSFGREEAQAWRESAAAGLTFFGDTGRDSPDANRVDAEAWAYCQGVGAFTRYFKATNEIDIRHGQPGFDQLREPRQWVERVRRDYVLIHALRPDAHYLGGSLVRVGDFAAPKRAGILSPGAWFQQCLELGLDRYQDAWDVHAYPQDPPRLDGPIGNSPIEDERGLLAVYARLGRSNRLPFWLGETGAIAAHGDTGRRWQAETVAKMIAWVNARSDYRGIGFCLGHEYDWAYGRLWDYSMGHKPGEAAMITASALIDGLPYQPIPADDPGVQAARFGGTTMIWRTDGKLGEYSVTTAGPGPWILVNVVGTAREIAPVNGQVRVPVSSSPIYVLSQTDYLRLTRWDATQPVAGSDAIPAGDATAAAVAKANGPFASGSENNAKPVRVAPSRP